MWNLAAYNIRMARERQDKLFTKYAKTVILQVGNMVYLKHYILKPWEAKWLSGYRIIKFHGKSDKAGGINLEL